MAEDRLMKDFFISYNKADREKAEWIAWILEEAHFTTVIQAWDFGPGENFVLAMQKAASETKKTIAVLSSDYLQAKFTAPEWAAAFAQDPTGQQRLLIPILVQPVRSTGLLSAIVYIDLVGIDEAEAKARLLSGIKEERTKPVTKPRFDSVQLIQAQTMICPPEYRLGQINRIPQREHFAQCIPRHSCHKNGRTHGFILSGEPQEWPEAVRYKLSYLIEKDFRDRHSRSPEIQCLSTEKTKIGKQSEQFLWELLGGTLVCDADKESIQKRLGKLKACHIFYRILPSDEIGNKEFVVSVLSAWSRLTLVASSPSHFLLLICATHNPKPSVFSWLQRFKPTPSALSWHEEIKPLLMQHGLSAALLPELHSPSIHEDISDWLRSHINEDPLRESIETLLRQKFPKSTRLPLAEFKSSLLPLLQNHSP
jgi:hypothetical protein